MSDDNNQPFFNIQRIYLKDMSLSSPIRPASSSNRKCRRWKWKWT